MPFFIFNRQLFPKIDINHDKKVSEEELYEWIEPHIKKHVLRRTDKKMKGIDTNNDGKVSWEEFKVSRYPPSMEKGKTKLAWSPHKFDVFIWRLLPRWPHTAFNWVIKEKANLC